MRLAVFTSLADTWVRETIQILSQAGHEVHAIDFATRARGAVVLSEANQLHKLEEMQRSLAGLHLLKTPVASGLRYLAAVPELRYVLHQCRAEMLLTLYGGGISLMAYLSGFRPYAVYAVGSDVLCTQGLNRRLVKTSLSSASIVFANGEYLGQKARELAPRARVLPLLLGVDPAKYSLGSPTPAPIRILCNRWFLPVYNNDFLIRGLAALGKPPVDFEVAFASMGPLLEDARALAQSSLSPDVCKKVQFLNGVSHAQMRTLLETSHLYVSLSRSDGTSTALMEAMLCGLFPVLSDIPQNREWIDPARRNGLLVPLDNPPALAEALRTAMTDTALRTAAVQYNRDLVVRRASNVPNMQRMGQILEGVLRERRGLSPAPVSSAE